MFGNKNALLETPADASGAAGGGEWGYAGFWRRLAALVVDNAIVTIFGLALLLAAASAGGAALVIANIVYVLAAILYWPVMESSARQATFGKQLLGLQVTDAAGARPSFLHALLRNLAKIISSIPLGLGFLLAAFTAQKQALHDMITKCLVVRVGPSHVLKAVLAVVGALAITFAGGYYYFVSVAAPRMHAEMGRQMEKSMKGAQQDMQRQMELAMKDAVRPAPTPPPPADSAAPPSPPAGPSGAPPAPKPAPKVAAAPGTSPAAKAPVPAKSASVQLTPAPARPAPAAAPIMKQPAPVAKAKPKPAPKPATVALTAAAAEPMAEPVRRAAPRKPAEPAMAAATPAPSTVRSPRFNDVMTAVMFRDTATAARLIELGWWADKPDSNGVTPLMAAAWNSDVAMTQLLLKAGADPNRRAAGGSVLDYAGRGGDARVVELLKRGGAK